MLEWILANFPCDIIVGLVFSRWLFNFEKTFVWTFQSSFCTFQGWAKVRPLRHCCWCCLHPWWWYLVQQIRFSKDGGFWTSALLAPRFLKATILSFVFEGCQWTCVVQGGTVEFPVLFGFNFACSRLNQSWDLYSFVFGGRLDGRGTEC